MEDLQELVGFSDFVSALGTTARVLPTKANTELAFLRTASFWHQDIGPVDPETLLVLPYTKDRAATKILRAQLASPEPRTWAMCGWPEEVLAELPIAGSQHAVILTAQVEDATEIVTKLSRLSQPPSVAELRRLTSLQRSFSQALEHPQAIDELLRRLQRQTNAVCLVIDGQGRVRESIGSLPLSLFLEQIRKTEASTQHVSVEGWEGHAIRLKGPEPTHQRGIGWLVVAARRGDFPNSQETAAMHIVATLVETAHRMQIASQQQENAIRASVFDEALVLSSKPDSPELASRLGALGFDFKASLRVVVASTGSQPRPASRASLRQLQEPLKLALEEADTAYLITSRDSTAIYLVQANAETITRLLRINQDSMRPLIFGIGREINGIGDISSSYADALIAIRTIRAGRHDEPRMAFEQFDFATRVFASVGLERMVEASRAFLAPLLEREPMLEALRRYFEHAQNTNATADALGIHHNTLRYRLAKVEELLEIKLTHPAAIASLFLAIMSLDLVDLQGRQRNVKVANQAKLGTSDGITELGIAPPLSRQPSSQFTAVKPPGARSY